MMSIHDPVVKFDSFSEFLAHAQAEDGCICHAGQNRRGYDTILGVFTADLQEIKGVKHFAITDSKWDDYG